MRWIALLILVAGCERGDVTWERMKTQEKAKPYRDTPYFADGRTFQLPPVGTVPVERSLSDAPPVVTATVLERGRERFEIFCAACHGVLGDGDTEVARHMTLRPPPSLHEERIRAYPAERIHTVISSGFGLMPSYAAQLDGEERWAVAEYVKALQLSQSAPAAVLSATDRAALEAAP